MPANQGRTPINWKPKKDYKQTESEAMAMLESTYVPESTEAFTRYLSSQVLLPEMAPYEHDKVGRESIAADIASRLFQAGVDAVTLVELYMSSDEIGAEQPTPATTPDAVETVYVVTQTRVDDLSLPQS